MTTTEQVATDTVEYTQRFDIDGANALTAQGWRLHTVLFAAGNIVYVMVRGDGTDLREQRDRERRRADRLAEQIQRVRNLPARNSDGRVRDYLPRASVLAALDGGQS